MQSLQQLKDEGRFIRHEPCPDCGSSDALARYDNGERGEATYCFSCTTHKKEPNGKAAAADNLKAEKSAVQKDLLKGTYEAIPSRGLTQETCKRLGYSIGSYNGEPVQIATYYSEAGKPVAQKVRFKNKDFKLLGQGRQLPLFGSHKWSSGDRLIITEGEIDMLSIAQLMQKTPCVSLPQGAAGAVRAIKDNWDYVNGFNKVVLAFDMDDAGRDAAMQVAELLPVGKVQIAHLPYKDANECLLQGKQKEIISAIFEAKTYRPDGIVAAADVRQSLSVVEAASAITYPYKRLTEVTLGLRLGEMVTLSAGSGVGKSTMAKEIAYHLHQQGEQVGMIMLEESNKKTVMSLVGIHMNKNITVDREGVEDADIYAAFDDMFTDQPLYMYDHFGSSEVDTIIARIHYMVKALDVKWIILDHISIMISGLAVADERKAIDLACTALRTLVSELNIGLVMVSHLRRPEGDKGHEEGAKVRTSQLRGSHSVVQLSDFVISLQVDPDEPDGDHRYIHVLKNRFTGETGMAGRVKYVRSTGRLLDAADMF